MHAHGLYSLGGCSTRSGDDGRIEVCLVQWAGLFHHTPDVPRSCGSLWYRFLISEIVRRGT